MARTDITPTAPLGSYPALPLGAGSAKVNMVAADVANGNSTTSTGRELIVIRNSDVSARTVTFTSVADAQNRSGDITAYSIPAGETHVFGPFAQSGWRHTDGKLWIDATNAAVLIGIITIPSF